MLLGGPGSGKSYSIGTLLKAGLEVFVIGTEPGFEESIIDACVAMRCDRAKLHTRYIPPVKTTLQTFMNTAKQVNSLSFESLTQMKGSFEKPQYQQFMELLKCLENFTDDNGTSFGGVDSWGPDRALVLDSLSGLNIMAKDWAIGAKPVPAPGEWGMAMDQEERLINLLTSNVRCAFVLTAHVEREQNEVTGGTINTVGAIGKRLAPKLPRFFSEVVHVHRLGASFYWSTITEMYDLKKRSLPLGDKLEPSFVPIIEAWRKRQA